VVAGLVLLVGLAVGAVLVAALALRASRASPSVSAPVRTPLSVDLGARGGALVAGSLFGLGVDLAVGAYGDASCHALVGVDGLSGLVRIGEATADNYDWRTDSSWANGGRHIAASNGCRAFTDGNQAASVRRVVERARALKTDIVVALNGEIDDPQSAAALAALIVKHEGLATARTIYWEVGVTPALWLHLGIALARRSSGDHATCSPDVYAAIVTSYTAALTVALGETPRVIADAWIANATDQSWTGLVTAVDTQYYPFSSPDRVPTDAAGVASAVSTAPSPDVATLDQQVQALSANLAQYPQGTGVRVFVGSWNLDSETVTSSPLYDSPAQGVFVARLLLHLLNAGTTLAAWASPLYGSSGRLTQSPFVDNERTPGLAVFAALHQLAGGRVVLPLHTIDGVDVLAVRRADGRAALVAANPDPTQAHTLPLRLAGLPAKSGGARSTPATLQTFDAAYPLGLSTTVPTVTTTLTAPPLGVVVETLPRAP